VHLAGVITKKLSMMRKFRSRKIRKKKNLKTYRNGQRLFFLPFIIWLEAGDIGLSRTLMAPGVSFVVGSQWDVGSFATTGKITFLPDHLRSI
jgi:hypothetical protein